MCKYALEERRKCFRLCIMYKIINKNVPDYLCSLVPLRVGVRANYNLQNARNFVLVKTKHAKT